MDFSDTLKLLKQKKKMSRKGWNGKDMYVFMDSLVTDNLYKPKDINNPCLILKNINDKFNTWVPSITDLFANDWEEVI